MKRYFATLNNQKDIPIVMNNTVNQRFLLLKEIHPTPQDIISVMKRYQSFNSSTYSKAILMFLLKTTFSCLNMTLYENTIVQPLGWMKVHVRKRKLIVTNPQRINTISFLIT